MTRFKQPRFRPLRARRVLKLREFGFLESEAVIITRPRVSATGRLIPSPFSFSRNGKPVKTTMDMIRDRLEVIAVGKAAGLSARQAILNSYRDNDWIDEQGYIDVWAMYRSYLDQSPTGGRKRQAGVVLDKGDVYAQKVRWRERQKGKRLATWIEQKRETIAKTTDRARRAQLEAELARLERQAQQ